MFDRDALRAAILDWLDSTDPSSDIAALTDLGAVHYEVLEMLSERIRHLHDIGYSKADIHAALSDDVVLTRRDADSPPHV